MYQSKRHSFKIEEAPLKMEDGGSVDGGDFAKGGNVSSIEKKVQEVNRLIDLANKNDISVIDSSSTWESPMKYKPIKYSNGTLYIEYQELDLYKNNRTGISEYITKKDKVLKRNMEFDNPLNDIAKMYRKALKQADIIFEDGGSVDEIYTKGGNVKNGINWYKYDGQYEAEFGNFFLYIPLFYLIKTLINYIDKKQYLRYLSLELRKT